MARPAKSGKSKQKKDQEEILIVSLVKEVREDDDESAFIRVRQYLNSYIKLFGQKYRIPGCDADEIEQECLFALRYKAIEDFDDDRGKFRSFAILCIKRHLFSLIKSSKQQKRRVQNESLSLDEDRAEGENLNLGSIVAIKGLTASESLEKKEDGEVKKRKLMSRLSRLEKEVLKLYLQQFRYDEMVDELRRVNKREKFTGRRINKKSIDNSLQRIRKKAQDLADTLDWL